jgi:small subunit ribosomal protein S2
MPQETAVTNGAEIFAADPSLREMIDAGVFFGRMRTRTNPKMRAYILTTRNNVEIINLEKTKEFLDNALEFLKIRAKEGASFLFVGTQPAASDAILALAQEFKMPAVVTRWLGGTLTNFRVISKRLEYYKKLKSDWENAAFREKYTKKERLGIEKELVKLTGEMSSLEPMTDRPKVLIIVDPNIHLAAVKEAIKLNIPVISLINTDVNPDLITYPVPGNNKARASVTWFLGKIKEALAQGTAEAKTIKEQKVLAEQAKTETNGNQGANTGT